MKIVSIAAPHIGTQTNKNISPHAEAPTTIDTMITKMNRAIIAYFSLRHFFSNLIISSSTLTLSFSKPVLFVKSSTPQF